MSYIIRASWWNDPVRWEISTERFANGAVETLLKCAREVGRTEGLVTITHNGKVLHKFDLAKFEETEMPE